MKLQIIIFSLLILSMMAQPSFQQIEPIKIDSDNIGEIWQLPSGQKVFKTGGEAPIQVFDENLQDYKPYILNDLGGGNYEVQSGRIATTFSGETITHYDTNLTNQKATEHAILLKKQGAEYIEIPLTLVDRTATITNTPVDETVGGYSVSDSISTVSIIENWTAGKNAELLEIKYDFEEGKPLKHTFTMVTPNTNDYRLYHSFNIFEDEIKLKTKSTSLDSAKEEIEIEIEKGRVKIQQDTTIISDNKETGTITKSISSDVFRKTEIVKTLDDSLIIGEIVAPSLTNEAWLKFIEAYVDTSDPNTNLIQFRYGDWSLKGGESFVLDPDTYSAPNPTSDGYILDSNNSNTCNIGVGKDTSDVVVASQVFDVTISTNDCLRGFMQWPLTDIEDNSVVLDTLFKFEIVTTSLPEPCSLTELTTKPSTAAASDIFTDIGDGTIYVDNDSFCTTTGTNKSIDLGTDADARVQTMLTGGDWFGLGYKAYDETPDGQNRKMYIESNEGSPTPAPTLEITYSEVTSGTAIPIFYENDASTVVTDGTIILTNATDVLSQAVNSTGQAKFTDLTSNYNVTMKEGTDNIVVNKTINYASSTYDLWGTPSQGSFIFDIDCSDSGTGNDLELLLNDTDGHHITSFTTPVCSPTNVITTTATFTANGQDSDSYDSLLIVRGMNTTHFGDAYALSIDGSSVGTTFAGSKITSDTFTVGNGLTSNTVPIILTLKYIPDAPTSLTATTLGSNKMDLSWTATTNAGNGTISGYKIERKTTGSYSTIVADTGSTSTTYQDSGLQASTAYTYRVTSINEVGTGDNYSNEATDTTEEAIGSGGTPPPASGGGGGGGELPESDNSKLLELNLLPKTINVIPGLPSNGEITIQWNSANDLTLLSITPDDNAGWFNFGQFPKTLKGNGETSEEIVTFAVQPPERLCEAGKVTNVCFEPVGEKIVLSAHGSIDNRDVFDDSIVTLSIAPSTQVASYMIIGAFGFLGIIMAANLAGKGGKTHKKSKKSKGTLSSRLKKL